MERRKKTPIQLETSVAAESILAFANEQLNKVAESDQQSTLEQVLQELQTWRAGSWLVMITGGACGCGYQNKSLYKEGAGAFSGW